MTTQSSLSSYFKDSIFLVCILGVLFGVYLGNRPFAAPDEGRYVEIPREMVVTGDYLTPRLNGLKYFEKPVLFYWMQAGMIHLFGMSEWAMRLLPVFFGILGCVFVYVAARHLFDRLTGWCSAVVLATSFLYFGLSRLIVLDMAVAVLLAAAMWLFIMGVQAPPGLGRRWYAWGLGAALGLATLTKGLMSLCVFGGVSFIWVLGNNYWKRLLPLYWPSTLLIFLLITAPWHILVSLKNPEFFDFYFIREHFERYLTNVHHRTQPFWFFIPILLVGFMPWTAFLWTGFKNMISLGRSDRAKRGTASFLIIWVLFILFFFSFSDSKLITYIVPAFPPLAVIVGVVLSRAMRGKTSLLPGAIIYASISSLVVIAYQFLHAKIPADDFSALSSHIHILLWTFIAGVFMPLLGWWKWKNKGILVAVLVITLTQLLVLTMGAKNATRVSAKKTAQAILTHMPANTKVFLYRSYFQDLPVYLNRTVPLVESYGGELYFGASQEPQNKIIWKENNFWPIWHGAEPVCIVTHKRRLSHLEAHKDFTPHTLVDNPDCYAFCNQPPAKE